MHIDKEIFDRIQCESHNHSVKLTFEHVTWALNYLSKHKKGEEEKELFAYYISAVWNIFHFYVYNILYFFLGERNSPVTTECLF